MRYMVTKHEEGNTIETVAVTLVAYTQEDKEQLYALFNHTRNSELLGSILCFQIKDEIGKERYYNSEIKTKSREPFYR